MELTLLNWREEESTQAAGVEGGMREANKPALFYMVLLQVGSVQAEPCYFWLALNDGGSPVRQTHDFLTTREQVWLNSQA